ncbi:MAG TPA: hypothetical protein VJK52_01845 [Candidatus Nanoarchaeia archaeon]|nr:hypothetical protein [Candidatus Nanoarchaeia archaeon]
MDESDAKSAQSRFSLIVTPRQDDLERFDVHSLSVGIAQEVVLVMVRSWLKLAEDQYHQEFLHRR